MPYKNWQEITGRYFYVKRTKHRLQWIAVIARYLGIRLDDVGSLGQVLDFCLRYVALRIQDGKM